MPQSVDLVKPWHFSWLGISSDWYYLLVLGLLCTCLAFVLQTVQNTTGYCIASLPAILLLQHPVQIMVVA